MKNKLLLLFLAIYSLILSNSLYGAPFGGNDPSRWTTEAWLSNVLMDEFSKSDANTNLRDVIMTIPAQLIQSTYFPFGDGQSNAHLTYGPFWKIPAPIVILKREFYKNGSIKDIVIWHPSLGLSSDPAKMDYVPMGPWIFFKPKAWKDWFVGSFSIEVYNIPMVSRSFPTLRLNGKFPDPENIHSESGPSSLVKIQNHRWGSGYNSKPYISNNVHGVFPIGNNQFIQTAVGGGSTWVVKLDQQARYKHLYTCFDERKLSDEAKTGTPTGAGWHLIGDPAESILNSLEQSYLPLAVSYPYAYAGSLPQVGAKLAFGLTDVIVAKRLKPGEMLLTRKGSMHWYVNPTNAPFCSEIIVHNCEPNLNNSWGINCN